MNPAGWMIQAIQGMAAMENLEQIRIRDCIGFTSLKPLENLENLKYLEMIGDRENFQSLNGQIFADGSYPQIEKLRINYADLSEVGASLAGFTGLDTLVLSDTKGIRTLEFLKGMGNLRTLELDNTFIQGCDWSFIGYCTNLTRFSGENSGIDDLSALEACGKLKELNVSRTEETGQAGITDITPLTFCQGLSSVRLRRQSGLGYVTIERMQGIAAAGFRGKPDSGCFRPFGNDKTCEPGT